MLFLGSKKFPKPTHFVDYITLFGGKFNGYTDFETTGYYFKIHTDRFENALDIFSRFFIDPLLSEEYIVKEVNSVNSEFERNIQMDSKRKEMVLRDVANPESLFHRFSTGNTDTLLNYTRKNNINLREKTFDFFTKNYRPDNMKLIVYGNKDIDYYKYLINDKFKEMKKPQKPMEEKIYKKLPWEFNQIGKLVLYETINNHQEIDINFMTEDIFDVIPDNSALYFKILLNYKGKGSLDDVLRKHGLVAGIKATLRKTTKGFSFFKLRGYCTTRGIKNLDKVIGIIYKYIKFIRKRALDVKLFNYVKKVFDIAFFFSSKKRRLTRYLKTLCNSVWKYIPKYWFSQHKILNEYNQEKIRKFGDKLVLKNSIILLGNKTFKNLTGKYNTFIDDVKENIEFNKSDPFYKTNYIYKNIKKSFIDLIDKANAQSELKGKKLKLFGNTKSLPKNISLVEMCRNRSKKKVKKNIKNKKKFKKKKLIIKKL
jgi:insulysin